MAFNLESLPNELILMTIKALSSPSDLYSLIRASKLCNLLFIANEKTILPALSKGSPLIADAYAACMIPEDLLLAFSLMYKTPKVMSIDEQHALCHLRASQFLSKYRVWQEGNYIDLTEPKIATSFWRLWVLAEGFVSEYAHTTLKALRKSLVNRYAVTPDEDDPCWQPVLSETERLRLLRAFFRFEIARKLLGAKSTDEPWFQPSRSTIADMYFDCFSKLEQTEMCWVYAYMKTHLKRTYEHMDDSFVAEIQKLAKAAPQQLEKQGKSTWESLADGAEATDTDYFAVLDPVARKHEINFCIGLGLPFARYISQVDEKQKLRLLDDFSEKSPDSHFGTYFPRMWKPQSARYRLSQYTEQPWAWSYTPLNYESSPTLEASEAFAYLNISFRQRHRKVNEATSADEPAGVSLEAIRWLSENAPESLWSWEEAKDEALKLGIFFWDEDRLRKTGLFQCDWRNIYANEKKKRLSVEKRLEMLSVLEEDVQGLISEPLEEGGIERILAEIEY